VKGWSNLDSVSWTADGKHVFASVRMLKDTTLLRVDFQGRALVLWKPEETAHPTRFHHWTVTMWRISAGCQTATFGRWRIFRMFTSFTCTMRKSEMIARAALKWTTSRSP